MMGEPVQERAGQAFLAKGSRPFVERQVRGDDGGAALVALADQLEEEFGACFGKRHEAEFIDNQ